MLQPARCGAASFAAQKGHWYRRGSSQLDVAHFHHDGLMPEFLDLLEDLVEFGSRDIRQRIHDLRDRWSVFVRGRTAQGRANATSGLIIAPQQSSKLAYKSRVLLAHCNFDASHPARSHAPAMSLERFASGIHISGNNPE